MYHKFIASRQTTRKLLYPYRSRVKVECSSCAFTGQTISVEFKGVYTRTKQGVKATLTTLGTVGGSKPTILSTVVTVGERDHTEYILRLLWLCDIAGVSTLLVITQWFKKCICPGSANRSTFMLK